MIFFPKPYNIINFQGSYINGRWTEYRTEETEISADAQPMSSKEIEALDIGRDEKGMIKIYTNETLTELKEAGEGTGINGTYFKFSNGEWYEVIKDLTYRGGLINHNKYVAALRKNIEEKLKIPCL